MISDETRWAEKIRAFIAINRPDAARERVVEIHRELKSFCGDESVRCALPEQIHLTLKFLGNVDSDSLDDLKAAIQPACRTTPFDLSAQVLGCFPNPRRPRVIWIGLRGESKFLAALQQRIEAGTKSWREPEARKFHPHLTLGRVNNLSPRESQKLSATIEAHAQTVFGSWQVRQIDLMQCKLSPHGAVYSKLASFQLMGEV